MTLCAFDLETYLIIPGNLAPPIVCGSFAGGHFGRKGYLAHPWTAALAEVREVLAAPDTVLCGANIPFDFGCVVAADPSLLKLIVDKYNRDQVHDVQVCAALDFIARGLIDEDGYVLDPRTGQRYKDSKGRQTDRFSLETCVDLYLGRRDAKANDEWRLRYGELDGVRLDLWPETASKYPIDDAVNTLEVAEAQREVSENLHDVAAQCRAHFAMHLGSMWGMRTDGAAVAKLAGDLGLKQEALRVKFAEHGFFRRERKTVTKPDGSKVREEGWTRSTKVIAERVTEAYQGSPPKTEGGGVSCDRVTLEDSGDAVLEELAEVSRIDKVLTYTADLARAAERPLQVSSNPVLATGRASYKGFIQLIPRKGGVRECFVARPGHVWSSVDYAAIELSTLAQVCLWTVGRSKLAEAINRGIDPHSLLGAQLVAMDYETFLAEMKSGNALLKDMRQAGKAGNFGFPGMMGPVKFVQAKRKEGLHVCTLMRTAETCGLEKIVAWKGREYSPTCKACVLAADSLRIGYLTLWDEMPAYFEWVTDQLRFNENRLTQFVSERVRGGLHAPAAANTLFQGLAADGAKRAVWRLTEEMYCDTTSPLFGSRLMLFAHDETILETPEERADAAARRQAQVMVEEMQKVVPDVKVSAEPALMRRWFKAAEKVEVDGKLVPWEPKERVAA